MQSLPILIPELRSTGDRRRKYDQYKYDQYDETQNPGRLNVKLENAVKATIRNYEELNADRSDGDVPEVSLTTKEPIVMTHSTIDLSSAENQEDLYEKDTTQCEGLME